MKRKIGYLLLGATLILALITGVITDGFWVTAGRFAFALAFACLVVWLLNSDKRGNE
jgi:hypothetical protein